MKKLLLAISLLLLYPSISRADVWFIRGQSDDLNGLYRLTSSGEPELILPSFQSGSDGVPEECTWRLFDYATLAISPDQEKIAIIGEGEEKGDYEIFILTISDSASQMVASCQKVFDTATSQLLNTPISISPYPTGIQEMIAPEFECSSKTPEQMHHLEHYSAIQKYLQNLYRDREVGSGQWHWGKDDIEAVNEEIKEMEENAEQLKSRMAPGTLSSFQWGSKTRFRLQWSEYGGSIFIRLVRTNNPFFGLPNSEIPLYQEDPSPCLGFKLQINPNGTGTLQKALIPGQAYHFKSSSYEPQIHKGVPAEEAKILQTFNSSSPASRWGVLSPDEKYLALWVEETIDHKHLETPFEKESLILYSLSSSEAERLDLYAKENPKLPLEGNERVLIWDANNTLWVFDPLGNYRRINMNPSKGWECMDWLCPKEVKADAISGSIKKLSSLYPTRFFIRETGDGLPMDYTLSYYTDGDFNEFLSHPDIPGFLISQFLHTGPSTRNLTKPRWTDDGETLLGLQNSGSFNHRYGQSSNVLLWIFQRGENGHFNGTILSDKTIDFEFIK